jgi:hypothetical protein
MELVLEKSTNTHLLKSKKHEVLYQEGSEVLVKTEEAIVVHGEHGTLGTESEFVFKANQQEYNPVTRKMMDAID